MRLSAVLERRSNWFDAIRLLAAAGVMVSHSFPLSAGPGTPEPLSAFTRGQTTLGYVCVAVFLIVSGFLVTQSAERTRSAGAFAIARGLRVLPGLLVVILASTLILGPLVTSLPIREYFAHPKTWIYALRNITLVQNQWYLPGVFSGNVYPDAVNGSLWSLPYEIQFYGVVLVLRRLGLLRASSYAVLIAASAAFTLVSSSFSLWISLFGYFGAGALLYLWRERVPLNAVLTVASLAALLVTARLGTGFLPVLAAAGSYLVIRIAYLPRRSPPRPDASDLSYGTYLYAFPTQQTVTWLSGGRMHWSMNLLISTGCVLLLAWLSWRLVEKPSLDLKRRILARDRGPRAQVEAG